MIGKVLASVAAAALVAAPVAAAPNPAASLSVAHSARAGTATNNSSELRGGFVIPLVALVAVILGIIAATSGHERPRSP